MTWQPSMDWATAVAKSKVLASIRNFFASRDVIEVETPLLCHGTVTDVHLEAIKAKYLSSENGEETLYLQTSPEFAMKRLLASGYQSIYQLCKAFRDEPQGRFHNPEFTMLEWYRLEFSMHDLMAEVDSFLQDVLQTKPAELISYQQVFIDKSGIDPLSTSIDACINFISGKGKLSPWLEEETSLDTLLQFIFCEFIENEIGIEAPVFVHSFPASQASLAIIDSMDERVAKRFECYFKGIELANGFEELIDAKTQLSRFEQDNSIRAANSLEYKRIDDKFIAALEEGLPRCAGVALGVDRLIMLALNKSHIEQVISFSTKDT
ncbi:MAG: elongation factor P lysine(34) lysyltransferase [Colwelliaceae bacterium]|nr:elongation factor P lysine(34) lysyltransferase [Colwelliaceae bacterium]